MIHCPAGKPGPPYEVLGSDGATSLGRFDTLAEARQFAEFEAKTLGLEVLLSPLAQGHM
jgi:hypothetical protein